MEKETKERRELLDALINSGIGSQTAVRLVDSFGDHQMAMVFPAADWREEYGCVLWYHFPVWDVPYVGNGFAMAVKNGELTHWAHLPAVCGIDGMPLSVGRK